MRRDILLSLAIGLGAVSYYVMSTNFKPHNIAPVIPLVEIDPAVFLKPRPLPTFNPPARRIQPPVELPPHEQIGFGFDTSRNIDDKDIDVYHELPLEGSGSTYANGNLYDIDEPVPKRVMERVRYIRMTFMGTHDSTNAITIGGLRFLFKGKHLNANIINPHTGEKVAFPWTDADQHTLLIGFSTATEVDKYEIMTSDEDPASDPNHWIIEGSMNGTVWEFIDEKEETLPIIRSIWIPYRLEL